MADAMEVDDFEGRSNSFIDWLQQSGTTISTKIQLADLRDRSAGRGVIAKEDIADDEVLFTIPRSSVLTFNNSGLPVEVTKELDDPWLSLIVAMIYQCQLDTDSRWKAYFDVLPTEFDTPMFWDDEELGILEGSAMREKIGKSSADEVFCTKIIPLLEQQAKAFRLDSMNNEDLLRLCHRMGSTIMAYAFDLEEPDAESSTEAGKDGWEEDEEEPETLPKGMVPLADMLNADADRNNARLFYEEDTVVMKSIKSIKAGEEVLNDYGLLPSADVLRRYGYTTPNYEKFDVVEISLDFIHERLKNRLQTLQEQDLLERIQFLSEQGIEDDAFDISRAVNGDGQFPEDLCVLLNTLTLPKEEFAKLKKKDKLPKPKLEPAAASLLLEVCEKRLTKYLRLPSKDQATEFQGANSRTVRRKRMALQVLKGEKEVLHEAITTLSQQFPEIAQTGRRKAEHEHNIKGKKRKAS